MWRGENWGCRDEGGVLNKCPVLHYGSQKLLSKSHLILVETFRKFKDKSQFCKAFNMYGFAHCNST